MRSGYESFLRRQLLKPRVTPPRWSETQPAPATKPLTAPAPLDPPAVAADTPRRPTVPTVPDAIEETMPAILWRDSRAPEAPPAEPAPVVSPISLTSEPGALAEAADTVASTPADLETTVSPAEGFVSTPTTPTGAASGDESVASQAAPRRRASATLADLDALIDAALADARAQRRLSAVIRIGVARLDEIGDAWGESAITHVLRALQHRYARLLTQVAPEAQPVVLGDAVWVVLPIVERASIAEALVRQLLDALTRPLKLGDHAVSLWGHAGLAIIPHDGHHAAAIRRAAEVAGRQARARGRGAYQFYAREIEARAQRRLALEARLRHAITHDELQLQYQPRAEVRSGALSGAEALPVWLPDESAQMPGWRGPELLLLAEESGLGEALAHWSVRAACRDLAHWIKSGLAVPQVSVPLLPSPFRRASFVERLIEQVRQARIDPARLTLQLSPVAPMAGAAAASGGFDLSQGAPRLRTCREAGFRLAIDGAATSSFSLAALRALPLSEMRLDGQLLSGTDPGDRDFAEATIALGRRLGLRLVASHVTQEAHLDQLAQLGCDEFQGELLSDPLSADTWAEVMAGVQGAGDAGGR